MKKLPKQPDPHRLIAVVVVAVVVGGAYFVFCRRLGTRRSRAHSPRPSASTRARRSRSSGVNVGEVTSGQAARRLRRWSTMSYDSKYKLPEQRRRRSMVANSLVSDRYIQLAPVYTGRRRCWPTARRSRERTAAPAELDDIYAALNKLSVAGSGRTGRQERARCRR